MKKRKPKPKKQKLTAFLASADELFAEMMNRKPNNADGEIFLFSIIRDDPERPTWLERLQIYGPYEVCARNCAAIASRLTADSIHRIECRQGEAARRLLAEGMRSEAKYQQEIKAQPNN